MEEVEEKLEEIKTDCSWTVGGPVGSRGAVLQFLCNALSKPPQNPPADVLHMTYKTYQAETKLLSALLSAHGFREVPADVMDFNLLWTGVHPKTQVLRSLCSHQRVNHFPRSYELTRKDRLYKNIEKMQHAKGVKYFDFIPQTFVMPGDFRELTSCHYRHRGPWIVKPVASSRGRGIFIVNSPDEVPLDEPVVVAKYIENPLLVSGHKCDLRLYVAVTSYDPLIVYMYEEGLVRFATVKYDKGRKHLWNPCMHLCNYSINKHHSDYIKSEDPDAENVGHKWTLSALLRHLRAQELDTAVLMQRIEEVVVKSLLASATSIIPACKLFVPHSHNCFELYGFDILIDSELKPWLLEVNLSPSLGCDTPLDTRIKSALLADLLTLVGLPAVDPILHLSSNQRRYQHRHLDTKRDLTMSRRVQSADSLPNNGKNSIAQLSGSATILTSEESRIVRNARSQFERRGGFIRIFPSTESWKRYSPYLDPSTGIPSFSNNSGSIYIHPNHNYNLMLHQQLFPESVNIAKTLPAVISSEKLNRYERALNKGHCVSLDDSKILPVPTESLTEQLDPKVLKEEILKCLEDGFMLSKIQARQAFSQYLQCVLVRVTGKDSKAKIKNSVDDSDSELIMRFLQRANNNLRTQHQAKTLNRSLSGKDKTAIVAKQLSDYLYQYNRETESLPLPAENRDFIPSRLFKLFLPLAKESDLEQVLMQNTRLQNCSQVLFGHCGSSHKLSNLGLLHSLGRSFVPQDKMSRGDCDCNKKSLPHLLEGTKDNSERSSLKVARAL